MLILVLGDLHIPHRAAGLPGPFRQLLVPGKIGRILCLGNMVDQGTLNYLRSVCPDVLCVRGDLDELPRRSDHDDGGATTDHPSTRVLTAEGPGTLRIGMIHGHQVLPWGDPGALGAVARELDVDILLSGHTHEFAAWEEDNRYFVNPGSATGVSNYLGMPDRSKAWPAGEGPPTLEQGQGRDPVSGGPEPTSAAGGDAIPARPELAGTATFVLMDTGPSGATTTTIGAASPPGEPVPGPPTVVLYIYKLRHPSGQVRVEKMEWTKRRIPRRW